MEIHARIRWLDPGSIYSPNDGCWPVLASLHQLLVLFVFACSLRNQASLIRRSHLAMRVPSQGRIWKMSGLPLELWSRLYKRACSTLKLKVMCSRYVFNYVQCAIMSKMVVYADIDQVTFLHYFQDGSEKDCDRPFFSAHATCLWGKDD